MAPVSTAGVAGTVGTAAAAAAGMVTAPEDLEAPVCRVGTDGAPGRLSAMEPFFLPDAAPAALSLPVPAVPLLSAFAPAAVVAASAPVAAAAGAAASVLVPQAPALAPGRLRAAEALGSRPINFCKRTNV